MLLMHCSSVNALFLGPAPTHGLGRVGGNPTKQPENMNQISFLVLATAGPFLCTSLVVVYLRMRQSLRNLTILPQPKKPAQVKSAQNEAILKNFSIWVAKSRLATRVLESSRRFGPQIGQIELLGYSTALWLEPHPGGSGR